MKWVARNSVGKLGKRKPGIAIERVTRNLWALNGIDDQLIVLKER